MPRRLGRRTSKEEYNKYAKYWGVPTKNPPPDRLVYTLNTKGMTPGQIAKQLGTTSTYVEGVLARIPKVMVEARPAFKYAHETLIPSNKLPRNAVMRSITSGDHVLRIASWGKVIGTTEGSIPKHEHSEIQSVLHPREPGKCDFVEELRKSGKLTELLEKGRLYVNVNPAINNSIQNLVCPVCGNSNPVSRANLRVKCSSCGAQLLSVKIRKARRNR